ncbi:MAG: ABC transporter permease [bacterium]
MFFTILRQSLRMLRRQRLFSLIHVIGLAIGLAACAVIALFIREELSFDRHLKKVDRLYRVIEVNPAGASGTVSLPYAVGSLAPALMEKIPEVEMAGRLTAVFSWTVGLEGDPQNVDAMLAADPAILDLFELNFIDGDASSALASPDRVAISEKIAHRFFGEEKALGKTLIFDGKRPMTVAGVYEDFPDNSHLIIDVLIPYVVFGNDPDWEWLDSWYTATITYVRLKPGADPQLLEQRLNPLLQTLLPDQPGITMKLQPVTDIHLRSEQVMWDYAYKKSSESRVMLFGIIGVGILLLACVNFMNLATSRSLTRAREVGLRKVVGATRSHLILHFLVEAVLIAVVALPLALLLVEMVLPTLRTLAERSLPDIFLYPGWPLLALLGLTIVAGLLAGTYPAFVLSSFQPVEILRGNTASGSGRSILRRVLVTFQFVLSILLLLVSGMVILQIRFMQQQPLGFQKDRVVVVRVADESERWDRLPLRDEVAADPEVVSASLSQVVPGTITAEDYVVPDGWTGDPMTINMNIVCDDFIKTMGVDGCQRTEVRSLASLRQVFDRDQRSGDASLRVG